MHILKTVTLQTWRFTEKAVLTLLDRSTGCLLVGLSAPVPASVTCREAQHGSAGPVAVAHAVLAPLVPFGG